VRGNPSNPALPRSPPIRGELSTAHPDYWRSIVSGARVNQEAGLATAVDASAGVEKTAPEAALVRVQERRKSRLFDDLSLQADLCNPVTVGSTHAGSQKGSQRRQAPSAAGRSATTIAAARRHIRPQSATLYNQSNAPCKRTVSGSTPLTGSQYV
jgi:hypothetical protein